MWFSGHVEIIFDNLVGFVFPESRQVTLKVPEGKKVKFSEK